MSIVPFGGQRWLNSCTACQNVDISEFAFCDGEERIVSRRSKSRGGRRRRGKYADNSWSEVSARRLEELIRQLFQVHDLNNDGFLEEEELVQLNEKIHILHHGMDADVSAVRTKYKELFREKLDPHGRPVPYETFRRYAREMLDGLDPDPESQELILEQFIEEARSGRKAFEIPALSTNSDLQVECIPGSAATTFANVSSTDTEDTETSWNPGLFVHDWDHSSADREAVALPCSVPVVLGGPRPSPSMTRKTTAGDWRDARPIDMVLQETGLHGQLGWDGL